MGCQNGTPVRWAALANQSLFLFLLLQNPLIPQPQPPPTTHSMKKLIASIEEHVAFYGPNGKRSLSIRPALYCMTLMGVKKQVATSSHCGPLCKRSRRQSQSVGVSWLEWNRSSFITYVQRVSMERENSLCSLLLLAGQPKARSTTRYETWTRWQYTSCCPRRAS